MNIKLMADYECSPLWWDNQPGQIGNVDPAELNLSLALCEALWAWAGRFDATLNDADPAQSRFATTSEFEAFVRDGEALAHRVRDALGDGWRLRYIPPEA